MTLWEWTADLSLRRSRPILVVVGVITLVAAVFLFRAEVDTSLLGFARPAARALAETIERDFNEGGYLTLIFESQSSRSLLEPDLLHQQLRIMQEIKKHYRVTTYSLVEGIDEGLKRVKRKSLLDYDEYSPIAEGIMGLAGGRTVRDLEKVSRYFLSHPEAIGFYTRLRVALGMAPVQPGGPQKTTYQVPFVKAIKALVRPDGSAPRRDRKLTLASIRDLAQSRATAELRVYAISDDLVGHEIDVRSRENVALLAFMVAAIDALCIWALFRSRYELFIIFSILATSGIWTFGLASLLGIRITFIHLITLAILLGTGIDNTLVFGGRLAEERAKGSPFPEAFRTAFVGLGSAMFLTTFTTSIAFLASAVTAGAEAAASFYLLVSLSMAIALLVNTALQGAIRAELIRRDPGGTRLGTAGMPSVLERGTRRLAGWACRSMSHVRLILLVCVLLMVAALAIAPRLRSEVVRDDFMRPGMAVYAANQALEKYFGGSRVGYVVFTGQVESPALLEKIRLLEKRLAGHPAIQQVLGTANVESVTDLIDKLGIAVTPTTPVRAVFDRVTQSDRTANYVLNLTYREAAEHVVRKTGDRYDALLMRFFVRGETGSRVLEATGAIERELRALEFDRIPGVEIRIGGGDIVYALESVYYGNTMVRSFLLSLAANWLLLLVAWRRLGASLVAMLPMIFATILMVGVMAALGIRLNPMTVAIGAIVVGMGVDYPIHIVERFDEEHRGGVGRRLAAQTVLVTMGPHILACALTTVIGFGAACVFALPLAMSFGLLTGGAIGLVYLAAIFVLPGLLVGLRREDPRP